jgi:hypothetical protein
MFPSSPSPFARFATHVAGIWLRPLATMAVLCAVVLVGCSDDAAVDAEEGPRRPDAGVSLGPGVREAEAGSGPGSADGGVSSDAASDAPSAGVRADRFVTQVVAFRPGGCAGFGRAQMPQVVYGPPVGGGSFQGSLDVVSLGTGGEIVVAFGENAIVDGPGPDFLVFENSFFSGGNPERPTAELGEVSVSDDGETWATFACTARAYPYGACAGWRPVLSSPANGISPLDPAVSGGDPFDLADVGLARARFVRIRDVGNEPCEEGRPGTNGFDLDAVAIVHAALP